MSTKDVIFQRSHFFKEIIVTCHAMTSRRPANARLSDYRIFSTHFSIAASPMFEPNLAKSARLGYIDWKVCTTG